MADKKQQQKEQLRARLKAAERNKRSVALEKSQKAAGRVTAKMLVKAREDKAENYDQLLTKYKNQESISDFIKKKNQALMKKYTENLPKI